jgi:hypothetical protein
LCNIPHCCPPKESGPCLSPCLADHPLRPATRRRLGRPLPHQLADRPQAHPEATCAFREPTRQSASTSGISPPFDELFPTSGQVAYVLLNRSPLNGPPKGTAPLDLHTLGTPQAFVLSQDQTLQRKSASPPRPKATSRVFGSLNRSRPQSSFLLFPHCLVFKDPQSVRRRCGRPPRMTPVV